jgi:hypothetical protein
MADVEYKKGSNSDNINLPGVGLFPNDEKISLQHAHLHCITPHSAYYLYGKEHAGTGFY